MHLLRTNFEGAKMASKKEITDKVQRILANNFPTQLGSDGSFRIKFGSANIDVEVMDPAFNLASGEEDAIWVDVQCILVWGATGSPDLYEYIATQAYGPLSVTLYEQRNNAGKYNIVLHNAILGNFIDEEELVSVVGMCGLLADIQDDDLADRFGGTVSDPEGNTN